MSEGKLNIAPHGQNGQPLFSLRTKMVLFISLIIIAVCSGLSWYFVQQHANTLQHSLEHTGTLLTNNLARNSRYGIITEDRLLLEQLMDSVLEIDEVVYVVITGSDHTPLAEKAKDAIYKNPSLTLKSFESTSADTLITHFHAEAGQPKQIQVKRGKAGTVTLQTTTTGEQLYDFAVPVTRKRPDRPSFPLLSFEAEEVQAASASPDNLAKPVIGFVQIGLTGEPMKQSLYSIVQNVLVITFIIILCGIAATIVLADRIITPIRKLASAARLVAEGDFTAIVEPSTHDEVGQLTVMFNKMTEALKERSHGILQAYQKLEQLTRTLEQRVQLRTQALQESNEMLQAVDQRRSDFVNDLSHALKNPLGAVELAAKNMLDGVYGPSTDKQRETLELLLEVTKRLTRNIDGLHGLEIPPTIDATPCSLPDITAEVARSFQVVADQKHVQVIVASPEDIPSIEGDVDKLSEILTNLIGNAIKFTPEHGEIRVTFRARDDGFVETTVSDTGSGITSEEIEKVFDRMFKGKRSPAESRGWGLGLAITKSLVELHGGTIWVESVVGQGTRFSFTIAQH